MAVEILDVGKKVPKKVIFSLMARPLREKLFFAASLRFVIKNNLEFKWALFGYHPILIGLQEFKTKNARSIWPVLVGEGVIDDSKGEISPLIIDGKFQEKQSKMYRPIKARFFSIAIFFSNFWNLPTTFFNALRLAFKNQILPPSPTSPIDVSS